MNSGVNERGTPLARARAVAPRIRAAADEIDEGRRIPQPLADELIDLGMFRLLVPSSLGGEQMDWLDYLDV
ncbi:MAG: acyl-CoA dehydrogenase family protein, partial [Gammaproteobacteria bacterium]|nr:acyl-CoA dehydrogenase family protein [Gammaproteobacteria bacterium]